MKASSVILLSIALLVSMPMPADAASICLTYRDARKLWPRIHLWWYRDKQTGDHCWSNRRGGPPRNLKIDPIINKTAKKTTPPPEQQQQQEPKDQCCWPDLDRDANGVIVEPPRQFFDRWNDQPWIGRVR